MCSKWEEEKKRQTQIASVPQGEGFVVKDDVERAIGNIISLWMFGFCLLINILLH